MICYEIIMYSLPCLHIWQQHYWDNTNCFPEACCEVIKLEIMSGLILQIRALVIKFGMMLIESDVVDAWPTLAYRLMLHSQVCCRHASWVLHSTVSEGGVNYYIIHLPSLTPLWPSICYHPQTSENMQHTALFTALIQGLTLRFVFNIF